MTGSTLTLYRALILLAAAIATFGSATAALADSASMTRAARLTYTKGTVTARTVDNTDPVPAQMNLPLLAGVQLATGADGQAEVEFEDGSVVRLTPNSALSFDTMMVDPGGNFITDLSLLRGLAYVELRATQNYRYTVNAGGDVLSPVENSTVRIDFDQPPATFAVLGGTAHVERQGATNGGVPAYQADVRSGESLHTDASYQNRYFLTQSIDPDTWDQWNQELDQSAAAEAADTTDVRNNYAGAQGYGWSDLDANGSWYDTSGGPVWQPQIASGDSSFDPYGSGGWVGYSGVGYVWASSYPWGWTPYRCGSWSFYNSFGWGWSPGASCGGFGWGFAGGGRGVNIGLAPAGYRPVRVPPLPGHGPERPWLPVHSNSPQVAVGSRPVIRGPRRINGVFVRPIQPIHNSFAADGSAVGSPLHRDFPLDAKTHAPIMGLVSSRATMVAAPGANIRGSRGLTSEPSGSSLPASREAPARSDQPAWQNQTPVLQNGPQQRSSPAQSNARPTTSQPATSPTTTTQRYSPSTSATEQRRSYTPPAASAAPHSTYTPPPAQQVQHPTYTPPPAPQVQRPAYSPPPQPAYHPSAAPPPPAPSSAPAHGSPK